MLKFRFNPRASTSATCSLTAIAISLVVYLAQLPAHAQEAASPSSPPVVSAAQAEAQHTHAKRRIGDTTTSILQAQANGSLAGASLPMLGATANLSWQRYLDSHKHPIPETFTRKLDEIGTR